MSALLYRGAEYSQQSSADAAAPVQLTYRRNVYQARQADVHQARVQLTYRGVSYLR